MEQNFIKVPACEYVGYKDGKLWNTKRGNELKGYAITIRLADGNRYCFTRGKLIYSAVNKIHPLKVNRNLKIDCSGKAIDKYKFYSQHKKNSVINKYPVNIEEYRKLLDCIENNEPPTFVFDFFEEVKDYCRKHLRISIDEAQDLTMYTLTEFLDKIDNKLFPTSIIGYLQGAARRALALKRKSDKIFVELKDI